MSYMLISPQTASAWSNIQALVREEITATTRHDWQRLMNNASHACVSDVVVAFREALSEVRMAHAAEIKLARSAIVESTLDILRQHDMISAQRRRISSMMHRHKLERRRTLPLHAVRCILIDTLEVVGAHDPESAQGDIAFPSALIDELAHSVPLIAADMDQHEIQRYADQVAKINWAFVRNRPCKMMELAERILASTPPPPPPPLYTLDQ